MENQVCSYCGSDSVSIEEYEMEISEPFGGSSTIMLTLWV